MENGKCDLLEVSYDGLIAGSAITEVDADLSAKGQISINARTKLDEAHVLINVAVVALFCISHDTASHGTGHLTHEHFLTFWSCYHYSAALILY